jgi:hypothetical protein
VLTDADLRELSARDPDMLIPMAISERVVEVLELLEQRLSLLERAPVPAPCMTKKIGSTAGGRPRSGAERAESAALPGRGGAFRGCGFGRGPCSGSSDLSAIAFKRVIENYRTSADF